eukprot:CAMPEP_0198205590 /NCGR_PEP_ID=MMETSP1445-20131203/9126_1 /TAXON_ID=36898 /ORGANISM="Pyramimonas sp., Strain CCMP2087" /LENGTH=393 /DNA_ID=CAMNT_0043877949 /DNA_START=318 /DNA_END=1499 /DNA_ORIENTATION=+
MKVASPETLHAVVIRKDLNKNKGRTSKDLDKSKGKGKKKDKSGRVVVEGDVHDCYKGFEKTVSGKRRTPPMKVASPPMNDTRGSRLPETLHAVVTRKDLDKSKGKGKKKDKEETGPTTGRVVVVGDVHGCYKELDLLLKKCECTEDDVVVFVGDLVNKGPGSIQVIQKARELGALGVRGNHEEAALKFYDKWKNGEQIPDRWQWVTEMSAEDVSFLASLPYTLALLDYNVTVVHAGLVPGVPLHKQDLADVVEMRELVRKSEEGQGKLKWKAVKHSKPNSTPWACEWRGPSHLIFGHDARRGFQSHPLATGLDTGCVYGNKLTACILDRPADNSLANYASAANHGMDDASTGDLVYCHPPGRIVSVEAEMAYSMPDSQMLKEKHTKDFCCWIA